MYDFYWYPKCSTCKKAKAKLDELALDYRMIDLKQTPPTSEQFKSWFAQGEFLTKQFFNMSGLVYRELGLKDKLAQMTETELAELLASNGMLVKRPLLVKEGKVLRIGFKEADYESLK